MIDQIRLNIHEIFMAGMTRFEKAKKIQTDKNGLKNGDIVTLRNQMKGVVAMDVEIKSGFIRNIIAFENGGHNEFDQYTDDLFVRIDLFCPQFDVIDIRRP